MRTFSTTPHRVAQTVADYTYDCYHSTVLRTILVVRGDTVALEQLKQSVVEGRAEDKISPSCLLTGLFLKVAVFALSRSAGLWVDVEGSSKAHKVCGLLAFFWGVCCYGIAKGWNATKGRRK